MIRRPPRSTLDRSSAASDVYKRQAQKVTAGYTKAELLGCWDWWTGEITSPLAANLVDYMPDVVVYDENGQEISRERPTEPGQTLIIFGQGPRKWE